MQALILAGGEGSRLRADGVAAPKALVRIGGQPQLARLVETCRELGCRTITCAVREEIADAAREAVAGQGAAVLPVRTPTSLHTLVAGLTVVGRGSVVCTMVDTVMSRADWHRAHCAAVDLAGHADAVVAVTPFVDDESPLWADVTVGGEVRAFGHPGSRELATGGVYWLTPAARSAASVALADGVQRMRGYLGRLVSSGHRVRAIEISRIVDVDTAHDLALARDLVAGGAA